MLQKCCGDYQVSSEIYIAINFVLKNALLCLLTLRLKFELLQWSKEEMCALYTNQVFRYILSKKISSVFQWNNFTSVMRFSLRIQMNVGVGEQIPGLTIPPITWALLLCSQLKVSQFFSHTWRNLWFYADEILPRNKQKRHIFDLHKTIFSIWWYLCTLLHTCIYKEILSSKKV